MLKKQNENSGLLALGAMQLAKWWDGAETVTCCLFSLCHGEVKRKWKAGEARRGHRHVDGLWVKLNCKVIGKSRDALRRKKAMSGEKEGDVERNGRVLSGWLFSLCCWWKVEGKWVLEHTHLN